MHSFLSWCNSETCVYELVWLNKTFQVWGPSEGGRCATVTSGLYLFLSLWSPWLGLICRLFRSEVSVALIPAFSSLLLAVFPIFTSKKINFCSSTTNRAPWPSWNCRRLVQSFVDWKFGLWPHIIIHRYQLSANVGASSWGPLSTPEPPLHNPPRLSLLSVHPWQQAWIDYTSTWLKVACVAVSTFRNQCTRSLPARLPARYYYSASACKTTQTLELLKHDNGPQIAYVANAARDKSARTTFKSCDPCGIWSSITSRCHGRQCDNLNLATPGPNKITRPQRLQMPKGYSDNDPSHRISRDCLVGF